MKAFAFICALLLAGASVEPVKVVDTAIPSYHRGILEILSDVMAVIGGVLERGDPLEVRSYDGETELFDLLPAGIQVRNLIFAGFSNLEVTRAEYNDNVLSVDIAFVNIWFSAELLGGYIGSADADYTGQISLQNLGLTLDLSIDTTDGLVIQDFDFALKRPHLSANVRVSALGVDRSDTVMRFLNERLPAWVDANGARISEIIKGIVWRIIESIREHSF